MAIDFEASDEHPAGEVHFGIVRIEKSTPVEIWDGQHRTLGAYLAVERLNRAMSEALNNKAKAEAAGDSSKANEFQREAQTTKEDRRRLGRIVIPVTIALETNKERIAELFSDVADNAKGINATALARLDQRNVFNRVAAALYEGQDEWTLLTGMIDDDNAYVTQNNQYWTTYRDVASVAQTAWLATGPAGPRTRRRVGSLRRRRRSWPTLGSSSRCWQRRSPRSTTCFPAPSSRANSGAGAKGRPYSRPRPPSRLWRARSTTSSSGVSG